MPHFGLVDEKKLGPAESLLLRVKLHIRGGKKRLLKGSISLGIITLYDAFNSALQWYVISSEHLKNLKIQTGDDFRDDRTILAVLRRSGILDGKFDYEMFDNLVGKALNYDMSSYDYTQLLNDIESVMTQLGIMPFDETTLPDEIPGTI